MNETDAEVEFVRLEGAPANTGAAGATVSTVHVAEPELPVLPAASVCRAANVCTPSANDETTTGDEHALNEAPSREHSKLPPASPLNESEALVADEGDDPGLTTATFGALGGVASTLHEAVAASPVLPASSV